MVESVDFETYVKVVMPAEWPYGWPMESLRAGAIAIKQYAWYYAMHYRGGTGTGGCYDVVDNTNDQIYSPETRTPATSHVQAVESTWPESITKNGSFIPTGYRSGADIACEADADGSHLWQHSARNCALDGKSGEEILQIYFNPGVAIHGLLYPATTYVPLTPARVLDSRNGIGGLAGPLSSDVARTFGVAGYGGVPTNAIAVTGNLTVTAQTSAGYLFLGPNPMNNPTSSTLNFPKGDDRANGVTVALGAGGSLSVTYVAPTLGPTTNVIFDVTGYFTAGTMGATYVPLSPTRILDSRSGALGGPLSSDVARTFGVAGYGGVPANAIAVTGNVTVTAQTSLGYLYLGPVPMNNPTSSTLNFPKGDDRANDVTVALAGGTLSVTYVAPTVGPTAHVIFDVTGYFTPATTGAMYVPLSPSRLVDSRNGTGLSGPFYSDNARTFGVTGLGGVPANAVAVAGNVTVTAQTSSGFLYAGPNPTNNPTSSTLNFPKGDDRANGIAVSLGTGGTLSVTYVAPTLGPNAHVIFDVTGYFVPAGPS